MIKKISIFLIFFLIQINIFSEIVLKDFNSELDIPDSSINDSTSDNPTSFSFKIGKIDGDISILGILKIRLGYGAGFTLYPEILWALTNKDFREGIMFEQERFLSLDWITASGVYLHLFFNDNIEDTEFSFKYTVGKFFNSLYITNQFNDLKVNPFRSLKGGKAQDINFGFDWGNRIYKGRFDIQFDSVKTIIDRFKGGKKEFNERLLSNQYERGVYFYLPDKNITDTFEIFLSDSGGELFNDIQTDLSDDRRYIRLEENLDYILDPVQGFIKFQTSIYKKTVLIYYKVNVSGSIYEVGDIQCGRNGVFGVNDFDRFMSAYQDYFTKHNNKYYLVLNKDNNYSVFEEKNSYRIANPGIKVSQFNSEIFDDNNVHLNGFNVFYDEYTGCFRVIRSQVKGDIYNIYPFYDFVNAGSFYNAFHSPKNWESKNTIEYSCFIHGGDLKLSAKPIESSIIVYYNSLILEPFKYSYDSITESITINFEVSGTDYIEVYYLTDEEESFNLTFSLKNDFRPNKYLIIGDSTWFKMPIKLWEESYYFKMHSLELLYFVHLTGDFHDLLSTVNGKLMFNLNAGFSMYYPELKGITIVDDFEYELNGYKLSLNYKDWYPVNYPSSSIYSIFNELTTTKGRLYFRNMHKYGILEGTSFISFYDTNLPNRDTYTDGSGIGPYNTCDGFTYDIFDKTYENRQNTLSLVTEFELGSNQAVSIVLPISSIGEDVDFSKFNGLNLAIKSDNLTGGNELRIYVDAGSVTERYNIDDSLVQTEILDEGISYLRTPPDESGSFYLYKGKNDGINSTNDLDNDGILETDNSSDITGFIDTASLNNYFQIDSGYNNINLVIEDPDKLKTMRGIRITLYSPAGSNASGVLFFNQIRFTQSGWQYDNSGDSNAKEISPIEDSYLINHIFSEENKTFDTRIHFQRYKERTLKINLAQNEPFYLTKKFMYPIDIANFKKMILFIFLQEEEIDRIFKITLKDTYGNEITSTKTLSGLSKDEWYELEFYFDQFDGYNRSNKLISEIRFDFENELSDTVSHTIFIDEICMDEALPSFGFATKNEFVYSEPALDLKYNDFSIFQSPYVKWGVSFNTKNFMINEFSPFKDYLLNNDLTIQFRLAKIDFYFYSLLDFIFRENNTYTPKENLRMKIYKSPDNKNPLLFTVFYDYTKFGFYDNNILASLNNLTENRNLFLELGFNLNYFSLKTAYDIDTIKKENALCNTKYSLEYYININNIINRSRYSIHNGKRSTNLEGIFSLDNLGYLFKNDFITIFEDGEKKGQDFETGSNFILIDPVYFTYSIVINNIGFKREVEDLFDFNTKFFDMFQLDVKTKYMNMESIFFTAQYSRRVENSYSEFFNANNLNWSQYFSNFKYSIEYIIPIVFYPPFSSLYKENNQYINDSIRFNLLNDNLRLIWDWSIYLNPSYFLPYCFTFIFNESIANTVFYNPNYSYSFLLNGKGEIATNIFRIFEIKYFISENISVKLTENIYTTEIGLSFNFYTYSNFDIENSVMYRQNFYYGVDNKKLEHEIILATLIYKNFFKKNQLTFDKYGFEMSYFIESISRFHSRFDEIEDIQVDTPLELIITSKLGYRFNKNLTLNGIIKLGYSLDYSRFLNLYVHRFGTEMILEGIMTF